MEKITAEQAEMVRLFKHGRGEIIPYLSDSPMYLNLMNNYFTEEKFDDAENWTVEDRELYQKICMHKLDKLV